MTMLLLESFDYSDVFPTTTSANFQAMMRRKHAFADFLTFEDGFVVDGAHGGSAAQFGHENQFLRTRKLRDATVSQIGVVGMRIKLQDNFGQSQNDDWFHIMSGQQAQLSFRINSTGTVLALRGNSTVLEYSPPLFSVNQGWQYLEIKFTIDNATGTWEFRRDGQVIWTPTGGPYDTRQIDVGGVYWDAIQWTIGTLARNTILDDVYVLDGAGSVNNDYLGDTVVQFINPTSDGDSSTFTPSSGTNHSALVDEAQSMTDALDETDHIEGDATGEKDLFQYENLASPGLADATLIHAVQVTTYRRITAEQPQDLRVVAKTGTTEGFVTHNVAHDDTTDMFSDQSIFELDPDTSLAWTPGGIDGAQFGVEIP